MKYEEIYSKIAEEIEEILKSNKQFFSRTLLVYDETNTKILEALYDKMTNKESTPKIKFPNNKTLYSWREDSNVAICYITEDITDSKYTYSQGYAVRIRNLSRKLRGSVIFIGTPNKLSLDSFDTTATYLSKTLLSKENILKRMIDKLESKISEGIRTYLVNYLKNQSLFINNKFEFIFEFLHKFLQKTDEVTFATNMYLLHLIRDDELAFKNINISPEKYLETNEKITKQVIEAIKKGKSLYEIFIQYCEEDIAKEIDTWIRFQPLDDIKTILENWPERFYLSRIVIDLKEKRKKEEKLEIIEIRLNKDKHKNAKHIFTSNTNVEVYSIKENSLSLVIELSRPLKEKEVIVYSVNGSLKKQIAILEKRGNKIYLEISNKEWEEGLNYVLLEYKPTIRSKPHLSYEYYFYYNSTDRSWEVYEINGHIESGEFYINKTITKSLILQVVGELYSDDFRIYLDREQDENNAENQIFYEVNAAKNQLIVPIEDLEEDIGAIIIVSNNDKVFIKYHIYQTEEAAEKQDTIFDIIIEEEFIDTPSGKVKLGKKFSRSIGDADSDLFAETILNYVSYSKETVLIKGKISNRPYSIKHDYRLFNIVKEVLKSRSEDPLPRIIEATSSGKIGIQENIQEINDMWSSDRIVKIKEMERYKKFIECRRTLFGYLYEQMVDNNVPISCVNLTRYKDIILEYVQEYIFMLSDKENIDQTNKTILNHRSILLFFDFLFIRNFENKIYLAIMLPTHPAILLNLLTKQLELQDIFSEKHRENILSSYDVKNLASTLIPPILNIGSSLVGTTITDTSFIQIASKYPELGIYINLPLKSKGYEQVNEATIRSFISEIINFNVLDQGIDKSQVISKKIEDYLTSHPYLLKKDNTINITYLNPSSGEDLLKALFRLNKKKDFQRYNLRYNIYLLSRDDVSSYELGKSFVDFFSKEDINDFEAKMMNSISYVISNISSNKKNKLKNTEKTIKALPYSHITFVAGIFNDKVQVEVTKADRHITSIAGIHGFIDTKYDDQYKRFFRALFSHDINSESHQQTANNLFSLLLHKMNCFSASMHQTYDINNLISLVIKINPSTERIIRALHNNADWVCFIDQNLGVELFDKAINEQIEYLIDFSPIDENELSPTNVIVTTEQLDYIETIIKTKVKILCQHDITDKNMLNLLLSSTNYLAGNWALQALKDEYSQLAGKLGEVLALIDFIKSHNETVKMKDDKVTEVQFVISINDLVRNWIKDDVKRYSEFSDDLMEINIKTDVEDECLISFIPIEVKNGHSASNKSVIMKAMDQIESTYEILTRRFNTFKDTKSNLRDLELARIIEKNLLRYCRYFENEKFLLIQEFLREVINKIQKGRYKLSIGYKKDEKIVYGKIFCYDPSINKTVYDQDLVNNGVFIRGFDRIIELLNITEKAKKEEEYREEGTRVKMPKDQIEIQLGLQRQLSTKSLSRDIERELETEVAQFKPIIMPEIILGTSLEESAKEWGIIGQFQGKNIAVNLNEPFTAIILGAKGSGKSYTTGVIIEAAQGVPIGLNKVESKLQTIIFHYSKDLSYEPEYISLIDENTSEEELKTLVDTYHSHPEKIEKIKVFVTPKTYKIHKSQYTDPRIEVYPLLFDPDDLEIQGWNMLLYSDNNASLYLQTVKVHLNNLYYDQKLNVENLINEIEEDTFLNERQRNLAIGRIKNFAARYISKENNAFDNIDRGDVIILDIRDPMVDEDTAMALFIIFSRIASKRGIGNKILIFDEAHKYFSAKMKDYIVELNREIRHRGVSLVISSQDPKSIDDTIIELSEMVILHKFVTPDWLKHLRKKLGIINIEIEDLSRLNKGEAYIWSKECTRADFSSGVRKISIRPRATRHGGHSVTNV